MRNRELATASRWLGQNIADIIRDQALCWFGAALALVNAVTAVFWLTRQPLADILDPSIAPVCWPFLENCYRWRLLTPGAIQFVVVALLAASVANAVLFVRPGRVKVAYWTLAALTALKYALIAQDYRLVLNQHYMAFWMAAVFLLAPAKRWALPSLLVLFYFWAGLLKLNHGWLSGDALYGQRPLGVPAAWIPAACAYVVVLELAIAPFLLARNRWLFSAALVQFVLFHAVSYGVVGFFYPVLMFLLLSVLLMLRTFPSPDAGAADISLGGMYSGRGPWPAYVLAAIFSLFQIAPRLFPGDVAITGEGRMFALNMFDAPVECVVTASHHIGESETVERKISPRFLQSRIKCDPIIYFETSKYACLARRDDLPSPDFDLTIRSRRHGQPRFTTIARIADFCSSNPTYSIFRHNSWIRAQ